MAGNWTNYLDQKIIEQLFKGTSYTFPVTTWVGFCTATPTQVATSNWGVTEPSTGSYARLSVTSNGTNWASTVNGGGGYTISNNAIFTMVTSTAAWLSGTALNYALLWDAATVGNLLAFAPCSPAQAVAASGVTLSFAVGQLTWTLN